MKLITCEDCPAPVVVRRQGAAPQRCRECAKERQREQVKEWKASHRDRVKEYNKRWAKKNPDKIREYNRRYQRKRRAKKAIEDALEG